MMPTYTKYIVKDEEHFDFTRYPKVVDEIAQIKMDSAYVSPVLKADILISYTKNHSLNLKWITANPKFVESVTSRTLSVGNLESLFAASTKNTFFQQQVEQFIKSAFEQDLLIKE